MGLKQVIAADTHKVLRILDLVGKDAEKALVELEHYQVPIEAIASIAFPGAGPATVAVMTTVDLIQKAVFLVKQKYASLPATTPTAQMLLDEVALVGPAVIHILATDKIVYTSPQVESLVQLVCAAINAQPVLAAAS